MKPAALLDPWLVRRSGRATYVERLEALLQFFHLTASNQVDAVKFLPRGFTEFDFTESERTVPGGLRSRLTPLILRSVSAAPAAKLLDRPVPDDLGDEWLRALHECIDPSPRSPRWRDPLILLSKSRQADWPRSTEVRVEAGGATVSRVLACVQDMQKNVIAHRDINPWLLEPINGAPVDHVLPRPPQLSREPIHRWAVILEGISDWCCDRQTHRYYVPRFVAPPHLIDKEAWRGGKCFERARKRERSRYPGTGQFLDRWDRVWCWDTGHNAHWDVEEDGGARYHRIKVDGTYVNEEKGDRA